MEPDFGWDIVKWTTIDKVTFVTMWDEEHLLCNICFAMIQELMKTRPAKYCIINSQVPNFESKLLLLTNYLPHEKMCFYPSKDGLSGWTLFEISLEGFCTINLWTYVRIQTSSHTYNHLYPTICSPSKNRTWPTNPLDWRTLRSLPWYDLSLFLFPQVEGLLFHPNFTISNPTVYIIIILCKH